MACDATTLAALTAATGLSKLSDRDLMLALAYLFGQAAGHNATTATAAAAASKYAALSERELWMVLEKVLCL